MSALQTVPPYELLITVGPDDIDTLNHVNNITYLRWVQEAATAHWQSAALPEDKGKLYWVVLRHEIDYKAPAFLGETLIVRTWVGPARGIRFERNCQIMRASDRVLLVAARTVWCPVDRETLRATAVSASVRAMFASHE